MTQSTHSFDSGRRSSGRAQDDPIRDPYEAREKPHEPTVCTGCNAVFHRGRWSWGRPAEDAHPGRCPACRRIADAMPAGVVTCHGPLTAAQSEQIVALARHEEAAEKSEHALNRIMAVTPHDDLLEIFTTDIHLPRRIGVAIRHAFHGEFTLDFDETGYFARVDWHPPAKRRGAKKAPTAPG